MTRPLHALALIAAIAGTLTLAGCGRKGPLDPPPVSSSAAPAAAAEPASAQVTPGHDAEEIAVVQGQKKRILLDGLLN